MLKKKADGPLQKAFASRLAGVKQSGQVGSPGLHRFVAAFEGLGEKTDAARDLRTRAWMMLDANGNGLCSLAEVDSWILKYLQEVMPGGHTARDTWKQFRPSYIRAFTDAKDTNTNDGPRKMKSTSNRAAGKDFSEGGTLDGDDYVTRSEFRVLCGMLCLYVHGRRRVMTVVGGAGRGAGL